MHTQTLRNQKERKKKQTKKQTNKQHTTSIKTVQYIMNKWTWLPMHTRKGKNGVNERKKKKLTKTTATTAAERVKKHTHHAQTTDKEIAWVEA